MPKIEIVGIKSSLQLCPKGTLGALGVNMGYIRIE